MRFDNKFWLRLATRNDTAASAAERDKLQVTATAVMKLVQAALSKTEAQLADSSKVLQAILTSAADENGEWYLPLTPSQVSAMRSALDAHADRLDEALLSNAFAWIRKCSEDGFDSMMALIQKMLQLYAGRALRSGATDGLEGAFNEVVYAEEREWAPLIMRMADEGRISEAAFMEVRGGEGDEEGEAWQLARQGQAGCGCCCDRSHAAEPAKSCVSWYSSARQHSV